ncbi:MAG: PQQ-binding-like beta-propeller repeat protein [Pirellulales bacterium]|nr:PQQ-binding-like beta-propeller repeat protein [Pirellulales bacterium]
MNQRTLLAFAVASLVIPGTWGFGETWPQFRGPDGNGIAIGQRPPVVFGETQNVTWRTELPGKAWSSPVIADDVVWVTTAIERIPTDEEKIALFQHKAVEEKKFKQLSIAKSIDLKLLAIDFKTGSVLRTLDLIEFERPDAIHALNSYASPTPVIDGDYIYCHFGNYGTFCIARDSYQLVWKRRLPLQHSVGPGSSPFIHEDLLILIQDGLERQYVAALDKRTGKTIWETDRPEMEAPSGDQKKAYCTPIAITDGRGRQQLICMASQWMVSYDPKTGKEIWRCYHGKGFSVVPRPVYADGVVYFSTGFGKPQLWAVRADGDGDVTDSHVEWIVPKGIPAKPSPLFHDGLIYVMADTGVASCFQAKDGTEVWKKRIGGDYSSSPLLAGGHIYFGSHDGKVTVIKPGPEGQVIAENHVEGQIMASPAALDHSLVLRTDKALYRFDTN